MCVAMYHPAAGLHQVSLADIIRSDFRKLPLFIEQARKMLAPSAPASDVATADAPAPPLPPAGEQPPAVAPPEAEPLAPLQPTLPPSRPRKRGKQEEADSAYKQLNFLDL
jgi:hypothetical protein